MRTTPASPSATAAQSKQEGKLQQQLPWLRTPCREQEGHRARQHPVQLQEVALLRLTHGATLGAPSPPHVPTAPLGSTALCPQPSGQAVLCSGQTFTALMSTGK